MNSPNEALLAVRDATQLQKDLAESYDVIVVGSGAGGAVVAKELAERGVRVVIVEQGGWHRQHRDLPSEALQRLYQTSGFTMTIGNTVIPVPLGRCLGGTTVINSGTCFRLPPVILKQWREQRGLTELGDEELTHAFDRIEKFLHVAPADFKFMSRSNTLMQELFAKEGIWGAPLQRNAIGCSGCGMCCYGCTHFAKQSMDVSYLPCAIRSGAVVYTGAQVTRILSEPNNPHRVCGIMAKAGKHTLQLRAKTVILAAGTLATPQLLRKHRIARKNPHLGKHLTLHPATKLFAEFDEEISGWEGTGQAHFVDVLKDEGILFEGIFVPPDLVGMTFPFSGEKLSAFMRHYSRIVSYGFLISDSSEGRMLSLPFLNNIFTYSLSETDLTRIKKAITFLARILLKGGAKRVITPVHHRLSELTSLADVEQFNQLTFRASDMEILAFHPLGTCRIGRSAAEGVCDQNHQVFGTEGLFLCDGSILPSSLGVNPQMTIMALAMRLANRLVEKN